MKKIIKLLVLTIVSNILTNNINTYPKTQQYIISMQKIMKNETLREKMFNIIGNKSNKLDLSECKVTYHMLKYILDFFCMFKMNNKITLLIVKNKLNKIPKNITQFNKLNTLEFYENHIFLDTNSSIIAWFQDKFENNNKLNEKTHFFLNKIKNNANKNINC